MPLPPYIEQRRPVDAADASDYQTVYAEKDGAVAAPTAGLHFTEPLLQSLREAGIDMQFLTLHVGAGTFLPVKTDDLDRHQMHSEWGEIAPTSQQRLTQPAQRGGRLIAVGTTVTRLIESAAEADGTIQPFSGETDIFIRPATGSVPSMRCGPIFICRDRPCSCWSPPSPAWSGCSRPMPTPSPTAIASIPMATRACSGQSKVSTP